jgi:hypothetical protein
MKHPVLVRWLPVVGLAAIMALASVAPAGAVAALALGVPNDVAKDGVSMGLFTGEQTVDAARVKALDQCHKQGSDKTKGLCTVVRVFRNQCAAFAIDPKPGTPGFGWSIADDPDKAKTQALESCKDMAGPGLADACVVPEPPKCDKTGQ